MIHLLLVEQLLLQLVMRPQTPLLLFLEMNRLKVDLLTSAHCQRSTMKILLVHPHRALSAMWSLQKMCLRKHQSKVKMYPQHCHQRSELPQDPAQHHLGKDPSTNWILLIPLN
ncbi:epidermal growth factor receptor pathway substrate 15 [Rhinolophus ferrumequinum]|uniref:Epidermal growth factor receptor pathway substrate 15 n=1 Tax=Rhinolophus ferrumequinum TaxID=59479 RepID=A0A7J7X449_RHIFE|nr:epidermal growth factor receptor pathway substrate 15 [Rhinolophus ferrumequinum]